MRAMRRALAYGLVAATGGYVLAATLEAAVIRSLRPTEWELAWVSDVALAAAFGVAVYLWRHLLATRTELADRERAELVLQTQLSLAADIQRRLLPDLPPLTSGLDCAADLRSAGKIGGDFYDFFDGEGVWYVIVADVSGKGVPAAMALGTLRSAFRTLARQRLRPSQIAAQLSADFLEDWKGTLYVTAVILEFNVPARTLTYSNAGHPRGLLLGRAGGFRLDRGGPPLGLFPDVRFEQDTMSLRGGDACLVVTDGVTEATDDAALIEAGFRMLHDLSLSAAELCRWVMTQALTGRGPDGAADWDDDRTVVVIRLDDSASRRTSQRGIRIASIHGTSPNLLGAQQPSEATIGHEPAADSPCRRSHSDCPGTRASAERRIRRRRHRRRRSSVAAGRGRSPARRCGGGHRHAAPQRPRRGRAAQEAASSGQGDLPHAEPRPAPRV